MSDIEEIREAVDEAKAPGTFNILSVLKGRGYPKTSIQIYLDESAIYEISEVREKLEELDKKVAKGKGTEKYKTLSEELFMQEELLKDKISGSAYTVHIVGVTEGKREELYRQSVKKYPIEFVADNSMSSLLSGSSKKEEKESPERDSLFTDFVWQEHISRIVDVDGNEQVDFPYSTVREMRNTFPLNATIAINEAIEKLRTATALFTMETGEDFLAKP